MHLSSLEFYLQTGIIPAFLFGPLAQLVEQLAFN